MSDDKNKKIINIKIKSEEINKDNLSLKDFEYDQERPIGKGGFCSVYKATFKDTKKVYALKVIDKSILKNEEEIKNIINEITIMNELDSPNLLKLITNFEDENNIYIILPLCQNGQLYDILHKSKKKVKSIYIKKYLYQSIQAINALHKKNIIHRDIKPENILIDNDDNALLSDYGIATHCKEGEKRNTYCGTDEYLAPEVIRGEKYDEKIDIWAIGILIYECASPLGKTPFNKLDFLQRTDDNKEYIIKNDKDLKIKYDKDFDPLAKNLIEKIIKINPSDRLSIEEILNHFYFNDINLEVKNELFDDKTKVNKNEKILNELKLFKDNISKETYEKMVNSMKEENDKIKKELEQKKQEILTLKGEKESILNKNEILTQTLNEYKINLEEKSKIAERLTEKRINQLGEGETSLPLNINQNNNTNVSSFNNLLISVTEKVAFKFNDKKEINKWKYYEINDVENFIISKDKMENDEKSSRNQEFDINQFTLNLKSVKKQFGDTIVKIDDNLNDMKHFLKKNDNEFKDKFLSKIREFNNVIYEFKDKIINSIEATMEKINKEMEEGKNKHEKFLKDKISEDEKIIKNHELECKPKIDQLLIEVEKWKEKSDSIVKDIEIKNNMIKQLQETIKRKNEEIEKKNKIIKNYESTYH
jgi:serine/threonine protein kinase